jgi:hypothetical protein
MVEDSIECTAVRIATICVVEDLEISLPEVAL